MPPRERSARPWYHNLTEEVGKPQTHFVLGAGAPLVSITRSSILLAN